MHCTETVEAKLHVHSTKVLDEWSIDPVMMLYQLQRLFSINWDVRIIEIPQRETQKLCYRLVGRLI
jgi:hypothetical protein